MFLMETTVVANAQSIPFGQVVTRAGRIVIHLVHDEFENPSPEVTISDAPPRPSTPNNETLEGLAGNQWTILSLLIIEKPNSRRT